VSVYYGSQFAKTLPLFALALLTLHATIISLPHFNATGHTPPKKIPTSAEGGGIEPYPTPFPGRLVSNPAFEPVRLPSVCQWTDRESNSALRSYQNCLGDQPSTTV